MLYDLDVKPGLGIMHIACCEYANYMWQYKPWDLQIPPEVSNGLGALESNPMTTRPA